MTESHSMDEEGEELLITRLIDLSSVSFTSLRATVKAARETPLASVIDEVVDESIHHAGAVIAGWSNFAPADPLPPLK